MVSTLKAFYRRHKKAAPVIFFIGGFVWDSLTLQRIDHLYSNFILCVYLVGLMIALYIFNLADDGRWKKTFLEPYQEYAPLAVQFFLGGLSSAFVIFYFRSVSFTQTMVFFILLVFLLFSNEVFKHRISNKYLQFGAFFFVNFTLLTFIIPIFAGTITTFLFIISGVVALVSTYLFVQFIYWKSPSTRREISLSKMAGIILGIYLSINVLYYFNMIPPVPLSLQSGVMAYNIEKNETAYTVTYDPDKTYKIWRSFNHKLAFTRGDTIYAFTSIFAPSNLNTSVAHRWKWYDPDDEQWKISDEIGYNVMGGRDEGYRGFTYKTNLRTGRWEIDVVTEEGLILGTMDFTLKQGASKADTELVRKEF